MARRIYVNGESLVYVKGAQDTTINALSELGLAEDQLKITIQPMELDVMVEAWGRAPVDVQRMNAVALIIMRFVHFDVAVMREVIRLAMGGTAEGRTSRAGTLFGNGLARFAAGNSYVGLNIASPVGQLPWRFYHARLISPIGEWPLGVERSIVPVIFRAIPYTPDPWNAGAGATDNILYDHVLDN